jgi:hypothetical protein
MGDRAPLKLPQAVQIVNTKLFVLVSYILRFSVKTFEFPKSFHFLHPYSVKAIFGTTV